MFLSPRRLPASGPPRLSDRQRVLAAWRGIDLSPQELAIPSSTQYEHVRMLAASGTYTFRPTLLNEFRFGLTNDLTGTANPYNGKPFTQTAVWRLIERYLGKEYLGSTRKKTTGCKVGVRKHRQAS